MFGQHNLAPKCRKQFAAYFSLKLNFEHHLALYRIFISPFDQQILSICFLRKIPLWYIFAVLLILWGVYYLNAVELIILNTERLQSNDPIRRYKNLTRRSRGVILVQSGKFSIYWKGQSSNEKLQGATSASVGEWWPYVGDFQVPWRLVQAVDKRYWLGRDGYSEGNLDDDNDELC